MNPEILGYANFNSFLHYIITSSYLPLVVSLLVERGA